MAARAEPDPLETEWEELTAEYERVSAEDTAEAPLTDEQNVRLAEILKRKDEITKLLLAKTKRRSTPPVARVNEIATDVRPNPNMNSSSQSFASDISNLLKGIATLTIGEELPDIGDSLRADQEQEGQRSTRQFPTRTSQVQPFKGILPNRSMAETTLAFQTFLYKILTIAKQEGLTEAETIQSIVLKLEGESASLLISNPEATDSLRNLIKSLKKRYATPLLNPDMSYNELFAIRQEPQETLQSFADRLQRLTHMAMPAYDQNSSALKEQTMKSLFLRGIANARLRINVMNLPVTEVKDLKTALESALRLQINDDLTGGSHIFAIQQTPPPSGNNGMSRVRCYNCNQFGHFQSQCPHPRQNPRGMEQGERNFSGYGNYNRFQGYNSQGRSGPSGKPRPGFSQSYGMYSRGSWRQACPPQEQNGQNFTPPRDEQKRIGYPPAAASQPNNQSKEDEVDEILYRAAQATDNYINAANSKNF